MDWIHTHHWEDNWWQRNQFNTYAEERKQLKYAEKMGLVELQNEVVFFNLRGKSVLDIGGGMTSLLLKCANRGYSVILDPIPLPKWAKIRYQEANIRFIQKKAETMPFLLGTDVFDEVWIYNVLQHTQDPARIIKNAQMIGKVIRFFDWIDTPAHPGHPQTLTEDMLNKLLGGFGKVIDYSEDKEMGYNKAYAGVFPTKNYEKV